MASSGPYPAHATFRDVEKYKLGDDPTYTTQNISIAGPNHGGPTALVSCALGTCDERGRAGGRVCDSFYEYLAEA